MTGVSWTNLRMGVWVAFLSGVVLALLIVASTVPRTAGADEGGDTGSDSRRCHKLPRQVPHLVLDAEVQDGDCLKDLTTAHTKDTGHTQEDDWRGLNAQGTNNPIGVPGLQVDGYFPDERTTPTTNTYNGWVHDSQFVVRFPNDWNGKLVITGAPGVRRQYANDFIISDWVLARGYAFASTDKGNGGVEFYDDESEPGGSVLEWHRRVEHYLWSRGSCHNTIQSNVKLYGNSRCNVRPPMDHHEWHMYAEQRSGEYYPSTESNSFKCKYGSKPVCSNDNFSIKHTDRRNGVVVNSQWCWRCNRNTFKSDINIQWSRGHNVRASLDDLEWIVYAQHG